MAKVITFSRTFPSYHPRAGEPTYFVEKCFASFLECGLTHPEKYIFGYQPYEAFWKHGLKHHTIRAGHRFKAGDWFSPRVWSGKPYNSKQIQFAPDIQVKKVWDFQIVRLTDGILSSYEMFIRSAELPLYGLVAHGSQLMENDGLDYNDFCDWFKMDNAKKTIHFDGQIICWNESIEYTKQLEAPMMGMSY